MAIQEMGGSANVMAEALLGTAQASAQARVEQQRIAAGERANQVNAQISREALASQERMAGQQLMAQQTLAELGLRGQLALGEQSGQQEMAVSKLREDAATARQTEALNVQDRNAREDRVLQEAMERLRVQTQKDLMNMQQAYALQEQTVGQINWQKRAEILGAMRTKEASTYVLHQLMLAYPQLRMAAMDRQNQAAIMAAQAGALQDVNRAEEAIQRSEANAANLAQAAHTELSKQEPSAGITYDGYMNALDALYSRTGVQWGNTLGPTTTDRWKSPEGLVGRFAEALKETPEGKDLGPDALWKKAQELIRGKSLETQTTAYRQATAVGQEYAPYAGLWQFLPAEQAKKAADVMLGAAPANMTYLDKMQILRGLRSAGLAVTNWSETDGRMRDLKNGAMGDLARWQTQLAERLGNPMEPQQYYAPTKMLGEIMARSSGNLQQVVQELSGLMAPMVREAGLDRTYRDLLPDYPGQPVGMAR